MQEEPLNKLSLEVLKAREKMLKISVSLIIASIIVMTIAGIFLTYKNGFSVFTVLPIIFLSIVVINANNLKKVKAEIASRDK